MNPPFNPRLVMAAMWVSECWMLSASQWGHSKSPMRMRQVLHDRARAVVVHDRVLNGRTE